MSRPAIKDTPVDLETIITIKRLCATHRIPLARYWRITGLGPAGVPLWAFMAALREHMLVEQQAHAVDASLITFKDYLTRAATGTEAVQQIIELVETELNHLKAKLPHILEHEAEFIATKHLRPMHETLLMITAPGRFTFSES